MFAPSTVDFQLSDEQSYCNEVNRQLSDIQKQVYEHLWFILQSLNHIADNCTSISKVAKLSCLAVAEMYEYSPPERSIEIYAGALVWIDTPV